MEKQHSKGFTENHDIDAVIHGKTVKASSSNDSSIKTCSGCGKLRPVTEYYSKGNRTDSQCKACILKKKAKKRRMKLLSLRAAQRRSKQSVDVLDAEIVEVPTGTNADLDNVIKSFTIEMLLGFTSDVKSS